MFGMPLFGMPVIAVLLAVAIADEAPSDPPTPPTGAAAAPAPAERIAGGWIKTFASEAIEPGAPFEAPDYLGSLVETSVRAAMRRALEGKGFIEQAPGGGDLITLSVAVKEPKPKSGAKPLPQSPIRLEGVDSDPTDNIRDPEVRPFIAIPTGKKAPAATPSIEVTIYARRGDRRIWSGYAGAPANAGGREQLAVGLANALLAHFGETVDLPQAEIALDAQPGAEP